MKNRNRTQTDRVLAFIRRTGGITSLQAYEQLGVTRLSARIWELRHDLGLDIRGKVVERKNRFGVPVRFYRYTEVR